MGDRARFSNVSRYGLVKVFGLEWFDNVLYCTMGLQCNLHNKNSRMDDRGIKCQYI